MTTLAFRASGQPVPRPAFGPLPMPGGRMFGALKQVLFTLAALTVLVAMVIAIRVGVYAAFHADQPIFRELINLFLS